MKVCADGGKRFSAGGFQMKMAKRRAFTLIELLVVIAIIAILAGLLLPALSRAKQRAYMATDLNNTRQIVMSMHMYAGDNSDFMPRPGWQIADSCWAYGYPFNYSSTSTAAGYAAAYPGQLASVATGQLYPYMKEAKLLMCPGDKPEALFYAREMYISSYVWNGAMSAYDTSSDKTYKLAQFQPGAILQWESDEMEPISFTDGGNVPYEGFTRRHGGSRSGDSTQNASARATIGRFDGSSAWESVVALYKLSGGLWDYPIGPFPAATAAANELWCNPEMPNGGPGKM